MLVNSTDVFVIGGGPAGLAAAIAARQQGLRVVVADGAKPPIDKACGEVLMPDAIAALATAGSCRACLPTLSLPRRPFFQFRSIGRNRFPC